jgi:hypothetical protein
LDRLLDQRDHKQDLEIYFSASTSSFWTRLLNSFLILLIIKIWHAIQFTEVIFLSKIGKLWDAFCTLSGNSLTENDNKKRENNWFSSIFSF